MALLFVVPAASARARDPAKALAHHSLASWDAADGLPNDTVQDIAQTPDGYLWLATLEGLARFDGARFQVFDRANTVIPRNDTQELYLARDGSLWVAVYGGGLLRHRGGRFELITERDGLPSESVSAIIEDQQGTLWIGLADGIAAQRGRLGLHRREAGGFRRVPFAGGAPHSVRALAEDAAGRLWVGTDAGAFRLEGDRLVGDATLSRLAPVCDLLLDGQGALWIAWERGLSRLFRGRLESLTEREGLPTPVNGLAEDRDGSLWLASSRGVHQLKDGPITTYGPQQGLPGGDVYALAPARGGGVYVGSGDGEVYRVEGRRVTRLAGAERLGRVAVLALAEDRAGALWAGIDDGIARLQQGVWTRFGPEAGLPLGPVRSILEDGRGTLWVGTEAGGLSAATARASCPSRRATACPTTRCEACSRRATARCGWRPTAGWPRTGTAASRC